MFDEVSPSSPSESRIDGFREDYAPVNDDQVRLHYLISGDGPALLLIPGWPQTASWHKVKPELAKHFTVITEE